MILNCGRLGVLQIVIGSLMLGGKSIQVRNGSMTTLLVGGCFGMEKGEIFSHQIQFPEFHVARIDNRLLRLD